MRQGKKPKYKPDSLLSKPNYNLSPQELEAILQILPTLDEADKRALLLDLERYEKAVAREEAQNDFLTFVQHMWPEFISGRHHKIMAKAFEKVARGECKRLIINMPPRHTKSEFGSYLLPAWFLGKFPGKKVIQTSHTAELAVNFGRKVRNLVDDEKYRDIFPELALAADSKAAGRWNTSRGGDYFAIGVGGAVTGKGADLFIIDDPHSEQEAALAEINPEIYDKVYEWYTSGPRQRLQPGGAIVIIMCMTGDTPVLMADGTEKPLSEVRPGDMVATFDQGRLAGTRVNGWRSNGFDAVYKIQTQSGRILRANERHPFLVLNEGVMEWTRLKYLQPGDLLVSLKGATDPHGLKQSPENVGPVGRKTATTEKIRTPHIENSDSTANGKIKYAQKKGVRIPSRVLDTAASTIRKIIGLREKEDSLQKKYAGIELNRGTELLRINMTQWLQNVTISAISVARRLLKTILAHIGAGNCASTTVTTQDRCEDYCATTAILQSDTAKLQKYLDELHRISDFTVDPITAVTFDRVEEVFDVEIDRTENFIANGVVSHNTRWSKRDLTAQVLKAAAQRDGEEWEVIDFPAIMPSGQPLWPEFWPLDELELLRKELPYTKWMAQYMQNPTSDASAIVKREWWHVWEEDEPPQCEFILMSWDTAFEKHNRADYSACTVWGVFYVSDDGSDPEIHKDERGRPQANIILLNAFRDRLEFPDLKRLVLREYKEWQPDGLIIEKKASGAPLIYELRAMGIPVQEFTPTKGNDKISRLNAVSDIFASGRVWAPETSWAEEVIEEVASFPAGEHDDYVDTVSMALARFRRGGYIRSVLDEPDDETGFLRRKYNQKPYY